MQYALKNQELFQPYYAPTLDDDEFELLSQLIFKIAGITMASVKKPLVANRLMKRLKHYNLLSYGEYYRMITDMSGKAELQTAVDLLTTNETHFFREPKHFEFFQHRIVSARRKGRTLRIWSAACSSGEEAYTLAMLADEALGEEPWEIHASDINARVLEQARSGMYSSERIAEIPKRYLFRYCLKGVGSQAGVLLIEKKLRHRVHFFQHNLTSVPSMLGEYDAIFLRNVLIYFNKNTQRKVLELLLPKLRKGGYFFVGHSETLSDLELPLQLVVPSVYRKMEG